MTFNTIGLLSPGEMGNAIGATLREGGARVLTSLDGRSEWTRRRAEEAGLEDAGSVQRLVEQADLVLCVLVPSAAVDVAEQVARAISLSGRGIVYADLNAVAPRTAQRIGQIIETVGGNYVDGGIIGPPPRRRGTTRIYVSGPRAAELLELDARGLDMRLAGAEVGQASGLKMCYGALTKGLQALGVELLVAAQALGLQEGLRAEQEGTLADIRGYLQRAVPGMPAKAHRWVGEMEEIATCFEDVGLTPRMLQGAADMFRFVAASPIGKETPDSGQGKRGLDDIVEQLTGELAPQGSRT